MDELAPHFTHEWASAFRDAVVEQVDRLLPEVRARWPLVGGGFKFNAYRLGGDHIVLVLYPLAVQAVTEGPSVPVALPTERLPPAIAELSSICEWILEELDLPRDSAVVVIPRSLPGAFRIAEEQWDGFKDDWNSMLGLAFTRLLTHVLSHPPAAPTPAKESRPLHAGFFDPHTAFAQPEDLDVAVWRYMSIPKFIDLLRRSAVWLSRLDLLGDPFEGSFGEENWRFRAGNEATPAAITSPVPSGNSPQPLFVSCWHLSACESAAMWSIYAPSGDGVCVRSTYRRLLEGLGGPDHRFHAGQVTYVDYSSTFVPEEYVFSPAMHKRLSFQHEREVRVVTADWSPPVINSLSTGPRAGFYLPLAMSAIDAVHVAPNSPDWLLEAVEELCSRFGSGLGVQRSDMDRSPLR